MNKLITLYIVGGIAVLGFWAGIVWVGVKIVKLAWVG